MTLRHAHELISCLCLVGDRSMPCTGSAQEVIHSAHPPLSLSVAGLPHVSASLSGHMCLGDTPHSGWGITQLLVWVWANQVLVLAKLLF